MFINRFDLSIIHFLNTFAHRSWVADATLALIGDNPFVVGGVLMTLFWWAWIERGKKSPEDREALVFVLVATSFSVFLARALALSLPFRERPLRNPLLHFQIPYEVHPETLINWSSFPSDHAVVAFCVAAGLWMVSRRLGALAIGYAALTNIPRIYMGVHYPTDVLAGALVGIGVASLGRIAPLRRAVAHIILDPLDSYPAYLYAFLFVSTFEIGEMYQSLRRFGGLGFDIARNSLHRHRRVGEVLVSVLVAGLLYVARRIWRQYKSLSQAKPVATTVMLCRNRVLDFPKWKGEFDSHAKNLHDAGLTLKSVWRGIEEPNDVFFLFEVTDPNKARAFVMHPATAEAADTPGVVDEYYLLENKAA